MFAKRMGVDSTAAQYPVSNDPSATGSSSDSSAQEALRPPGPVEAFTIDDHDAVFGRPSQTGGPDFKSLHGAGATAVMIKSIIGMGVLAFPAIFDALGLVPGVLALTSVSALSCWSTYTVGQFKRRHPHVYGIDDAGGVIFGGLGREVFGGMFCILFIMSGGALMLATSIAINAVSDHKACTAVYVAVVALVTFATASIRTLGRIRWLAWVGIASIVSSVIILMVGLGVQKASSPHSSSSSDFKLFNTPSFQQVMTSLSIMVFSYCSVPAFFAIASEMRAPEREYTRAMLLAHGAVYSLYLVVGVVIYVLRGSRVASPAMGSATDLVRRASYGVALPGLQVTGTLMVNYASKMAFMRILRGTEHVRSATRTHWAVWLGCVLAATAVGYVIASAIPLFGTLVSLVGALFAALTSVMPMGIMWLHDNWADGRARPTWRWALMAGFSVAVVVFAVVLAVGGTWASVSNILSEFGRLEGFAPFSCADNSGSAAS